MKNQVASIKERFRRWFHDLDPRLAHRELDLRRQAQRGERARIARELHDTVFQGFLSSKMQLHAVLEQMPADSQSRPALSRVLDQMERSIDEGRDALRGLRLCGRQSPCLEQALARVRDEFASGEVADFRMFVSGDPKLLNQEVQEEIYRIGREALINALRHSGTKSIEIEIEYSSRRFRLIVRDNGRGIDPQVFKPVRNTRWGLVGMRERAENIGAQLRVWSRLGGGTEVELSVPCDIAFEKDPISFFPSRRGLART